MPIKKSDAPFALIGAVAVSVSCSYENDKTSRSDSEDMNIIFIMCDDHSYQTISAYDKRYMKTPAIDRLSEEGYRFTNSFVANSLSGPSRACLLTGKHSHANGFTHNESGAFDGSQTTFPKILQKNGYETAIIGKWHLMSEPTGFDHWDILIGQGDYYQPTFICNGDTLMRPGYVTDVITEEAIGWLKEKRNKDKPFCMLVHHKAPHRSWMPDTKELGSYDNVEFPVPETFYDDHSGRPAAMLQEMSIAEDMNVVYDLKMCDAEAEIRDSQGFWRWTGPMYRGGTGEGEQLRPGRMSHEQQKAWNNYYDPIIEEFKKAGLQGKDLAEWKFQRYMKDYCSVINSVDRSVARIYEYLEQEGMLGNTMIVYTSDQGFFMGEHGFFDKRFMYEESFRTPLIIRLPDDMKRRRPARSGMKVYGPAFGKESHDISGFVQNIDFGPTFLDFAGIEVPEDMHGESFLPLMTGGRASRRALYYHFYEYPAEHAVRRHYGIRTERYSLMHFYHDIDRWELYDLKNDPQQLNNIYEKPEAAKILPELKTELHRLQVLYDDPIRDL